MKTFIEKPSNSAGMVTESIKVQNGVFDISPNRMEFKPSDQQSRRTFQLPHNYDPSVTAPHFKEFLDRVLPDVASQKLLFRYMRRTLLRKANLRWSISGISASKMKSRKSTRMDIGKELTGNCSGVF